LLFRREARPDVPCKTAPESPGLWVLRRADEGNRTPNLLITNQLLYQLSYVSVCEKKMTGRSKEASSLENSWLARPRCPNHLDRSILRVTNFPAGVAQQSPDPVGLRIVPSGLHLLPP
jgi:hypothetical protein